MTTKTGRRPQMSSTSPNTDVAADDRQCAGSRKDTKGVGTPDTGHPPSPRVRPALSTPRSDKHRLRKKLLGPQMMVVRIAVGERTFKTLERLYPDEMDRDDSRPANPAWRACLAEIGVFTGQEGVPVLSINYLHLLQNFSCL
jgi:hypothetical protein